MDRQLGLMSASLAMLIESCVQPLYVRLIGRIALLCATGPQPYEWEDLPFGMSQLGLGRLL